MKKRNQKSFFDQYGYYLIAGVVGVVAILAMNWSSFSSGEGATSEVPVIDDHLISTHNEKDVDYILGGNKMFDGVTVLDAKKLFNNHITQKSTIPKCPTSTDTTDLPDSYNFRTKFSQCERPIVEQGILIHVNTKNIGLCSSSWAIAATSMFSDRYCATQNPTYVASAQQVLTCDKKISAGIPKSYQF